MDTEPEDTGTPPAPTPPEIEPELDAAMKQLPKDPNQMLKDLKDLEDKKKNGPS